MYDVIIVGAGPGGGSAAYFLVEAGLKVLVLEKETLPRYKACGGGISIRFLENTFPFSFKSVCETEINAFTYLYGRHKATLPVKPGEVTTVMRDKFDSFLLVQSKAEVVQDACVKKVIEHAELVTVETRDGHVYNARYVIGADGANSVVAHAMHLHTHNETGAAIEVEVPVSEALMDIYRHRLVFIFRQVPNGYLWVFPKADHLSIGIASLHPKPGELQFLLTRAMHQMGIPVEKGTQHGHSIPVYTRPFKIATPRVLLVGDAAGLVDPFSGEGIRFAIKSGKIAAESILSGHPQKYSRIVFWKIGLSHIFSNLEKKVFFHWERYCLRLGAPNPFTTQAILAMLNDQASTIDILFVALLTLPIFAFSKGLSTLVHRRGKSAPSKPNKEAIDPPVKD